MLFDSDSIRSRKFIVGWLLVMLVAVVLDAPAARAFEPIRHFVRRSVFGEELREWGNFIATMLIAIVVVVLHRDRWRAATLVLLCAAMTGLTRIVIAFVSGRPRPVNTIAPFEWHPFAFDAASFRHAANMSFPSGHASVAFGTAVALAYVLPRGRWLFLGAAFLVGLERVAELAHYVSDVAAAALLAVLILPLAIRVHTWLWSRFDENANSSQSLAAS